MVQRGPGVAFEEELVDGHVQGGDDLLRVTDQLAIQVLIKGLDVGTVQVQKRQAQGLNLEMIVVSFISTIRQGRPSLDKTIFQPE
jgi:hypothetical protein